MSKEFARFKVEFARWVPHISKVCRLDVLTVSFDESTVFLHAEWSDGSHTVRLTSEQVVHNGRQTAPTCRWRDHVCKEILNARGV